MLLLLLGCRPDELNEPTLDSGSTDSGTLGEEFQPPCDGTWGWLDGRIDPALAVHVAPVDTPGDGTMGAPLSTIDEAVQMARDVGAPAVMIWPGTHDVTGLRLSTSSGDPPGFALCGCGPDSVVLGGADAAGLWISDVEMTVAGIAIGGGYRGLVVRSGASVDVVDVSVAGVDRVGVVVDGSGTAARISGLTITAVNPDEDVGYGMAIQGAQVTLDNLHITGGHGIGLFVHEGQVELSNAVIEGTVARGDGLLGRGLHMQQLSSGTLDDVTLSGNQDAGLFALQSVGLVAENLHIDTTSTGLTEDGTATGDGVVITAGDSGAAPETFSFSMSNSVVDDNARAGVLLDGVQATLEGNTITNSGVVVEDNEILLQNGAVADGSDQAVDVTSELGLNIQVLDVDVVD